MDITNSPFTIRHGVMPKLYIPRYEKLNEIVDVFNSDYPSTPLYMLTGVRGSGKTTLMTDAKEELKRSGDWICISLSINSDDILKSLAADLYEEPLFKSLITELKIDLSILGIGPSIVKSG